MVRDVSTVGERLPMQSLLCVENTNDHPSQELSRAR